MDTAHSVHPVRATGVAVALAIVGIICSVLLSIPAFLVVGQPVVQFVWAIVLSELGFVVAAAAFLFATGRNFSYVGLRLPTRREFGYVFGGLLGLVAYRQLAIVAALFLELPIAGNSITDFPGVDLLTILAVLIPISIVVIGPAEELLFRGVVQTYLDEHVSTGGAIVIASVVFAGVHLPTSWVATPNLLAVGVSMAILFGLSLILGWLYATTGNLTVPILAHGFYDAVVFTLAFVVLSGQKLPLGI
jgi:membrane protease YdiL (CAAX protease family)